MNNNKYHIFIFPQFRGKIAQRTKKQRKFGLLKKKITIVKKFFTSKFEQ